MLFKVFFHCRENIFKHNVLQNYIIFPALILNTVAVTATYKPK